MSEHREVADLVASICWGIWKAGDEIARNNKFLRAGWVVATAKAHLSQWKNVQLMGAAESQRSVVPADRYEHWAKPNVNCVKVNCDAAIFKENLKFGVGGGIKRFEWWPD